MDVLVDVDVTNLNKLTVRHFKTMLHVGREEKNQWEDADVGHLTSISQCVEFCAPIGWLFKELSTRVSVIGLRHLRTHFKKEEQLADF